MIAKRPVHVLLFFLLVALHLEYTHHEHNNQKLICVTSLIHFS